MTSETEFEFEFADQLMDVQTYLAVNQYAAFRATANFTDASKFKPERFLSTSKSSEGDDDDGDDNDDLAVFQPFILGRHTCIGQKFAWAEMRLVLARLLYAFDMSRAESSSSTLGDWGEQKTFIFWEKKPIEVCLTSASS